tara:strand:+ start:215 stop:334 length:120 start_codon:yes stop_codon:yes gene_type:complete
MIVHVVEKKYTLTWMEDTFGKVLSLVRNVLRRWINGISN